MTHFRSVCVLLVTSSLSACSSAGYDDKVKCRGLTEGMSEADVLEIMGPPHHRSISEQEPESYTLFYNAELFADKAVSVVMIKRNNHFELLRTRCEPSE